MPDDAVRPRDRITALRLLLRGNGYFPVPAWGKAPFLPNWRDAALTADETEYRRWLTVFNYEDGKGDVKTYRGDRHTNTGIACGNVVALDIDVRDPDLAGRIEAMAHAMLGRTPLRRVGQAPKVALVYRTAAPMAKQETPELYLPDGMKAQVEVLGQGQQFIAYGVHPDTGQEYEWTDAGPDIVPADDLPEVTPGDVSDFLASAERLMRISGGRTEAERAAGDMPEPLETPASPQTEKKAAPKAAAARAAPDGDFFRAVNQAALANLGAWVPKLFPRAKHQPGTGAYRVSSADLSRSYEEDLSIHPGGVQDFGPRRGMTPIDVVVEFGGAPAPKEAAFQLCEWLGTEPATLGWRAEKKRSRKAAAGPAEAEHGDDAEPLEADPKGVELTQDGVAWAVAKAAHGRFVFDHTDQAWFRFDGSRWAMDTTGRAFHAVRVFCRSLRDKAQDAPADMAKIAFISSVERAARTDPRLAVSHEAWDSDRWLLGVPGGVVDLRTGQMRPAEPDLFIRRQTAVAPAEPGTASPLWMAFLDDATRGDKQLQAFLQRLAGYVLTGDVSEEVMAFFYGPGGNGKGVFIGAMTSILADYAVSVPIEVFTAGSRLNLEYYRASMAGARLVTASETEAGATWSESLIKELTGNEAPLSARSPYGRPFTFRPQFKLCLVGNHAPRLKGRTPAMERRLRVVPFDNEPAKPDSDLKDKLRAEYPQILRWMLDGCAIWRREKIGTADAIRRATAGYFEAQDVFRRWLEERCILDQSLRERPGRVQADYGEYLRESGEPPISASEFRELLERTKGVKYAKVQGTPWVRGLGLKPPHGNRNGDA